MVLWTVGMAAWLIACDGLEPRSMVGERKPFGESHAFTWANLNSSLELVEFGVTIPFTALQSIKEGATLTLALPPEAQSSHMSREVVVEYSRRTFLPPVYHVPRLEVRFYDIPDRERQAIDCVNEPMPDAGHLPAPFKITSTRPLPDGDCLPSGGVFAHDTTAPELRLVDPAVFQSTLMLGYHVSQVVFVSVTMPMELALEKKGFEAQIPRGQQVKGPGAWPSKAMVVTNGLDTTLNFSLGKLK